MALFANDDEDDYGQPREKSFLSKVGSFLWNALKVVAIIALAIVALVSFSDTARDKLDELTKDKDGNGGWGSKIRESLGLAKEKTNDIFEKASDGAKKLWNDAKEKLGIAPSPEDKGTEVAVGTTAVVGAGAYATKKILSSRNNALGTVDEHGNFKPAPKEEIKAAQELAKNQERLETLKKAAEKAEQDAAKMKADAEKIKASRDSKRMVNPSRLKDAWNLKGLDPKADALTKSAKSMREQIGVLEKMIEESTAKPLVTRESFNRAAADVESRIKPTTAPATATAQPAASTTPPTNKPPLPSTTTTPASPAPAATAHTTTAVEGVSPPAPKAPTPPSGALASTKAFFAPVAELLSVVAKPLGIVGGTMVAAEGAMHTKNLWDHRDNEGNSDKRTAAVAQGTGTAIEAGGMAAAPWVPAALFAGTAIKDAMYVADTITNGGKSNLQRSVTANLVGETLGGDKAVDYILDKTYGKIEKYDSEKIVAQHAEEAKRIEAGLTAEQKNVLKAWNEQAKASNLTIDPLALIDHVKQRGWEMPPITPSSTSHAKN